MVVAWLSGDAVRTPNPVVAVVFQKPKQRGVGSIVRETRVNYDKSDGGGVGDSPAIELCRIQVPDRRPAPRTHVRAVG